jgi:hypothetical protein
MRAYTGETDADIARNVGRRSAVGCRTVAGVALQRAQVYLTVDV